MKVAVNLLEYSDANPAMVICKVLNSRRRVLHLYLICAINTATRVFFATSDAHDCFKYNSLCNGTYSIYIMSPLVGIKGGASWLLTSCCTWRHRAMCQFSFLLLGAGENLPFVPTCCFLQMPHQNVSGSEKHCICYSVHFICHQKLPAYWVNYFMLSLACV